jgi:catechol 2,3-dioxygenase-like lactoylglutathione lyase family enzyme
MADPFTRGIHHLALNTEDMKKTIDFWVDVLGMPLVHAMRVPKGLGVGPANRGNPPYEELRHYFFDMGNDSLVAFFEMPKGAEPQGNRNALGNMQHVSFVVTPSRFAQIEDRLKAHDIAYIGPLPQLPGLLGIYFMDPNGIRLEFSTQPENGEEQRVIDLVRQTRSQVQAELASLPGATPAWVEQRMAAMLPA